MKKKIENVKLIKYILELSQVEFDALCKVRAMIGGLRIADVEDSFESSSEEDNIAISTMLEPVVSNKKTTSIRGTFANLLVKAGDRVSITDFSSIYFANNDKYPTKSSIIEIARKEKYYIQNCDDELFFFKR